MVSKLVYIYQHKSTDEIPELSQPQSKVGLRSPLRFCQLSLLLLLSHHPQIEFETLGDSATRTVELIPWGRRGHSSIRHMIGEAPHFKEVYAVTIEPGSLQIYVLVSLLSNQGVLATAFRKLKTKLASSLLARTLAGSLPHQRIRAW